MDLSTDSVGIMGGDFKLKCNKNEGTQREKTILKSTPCKCRKEIFVNKLSDSLTSILVLHCSLKSRLLSVILCFAMHLQVTHSETVKEGNALSQ